MSALSLKEYNLLQCKIFEKHCVDMTDTVKFYQLCSMLSRTRNMSVEEAEAQAELIMFDFKREVAG